MSQIDVVTQVPDPIKRGSDRGLGGTGVQRPAAGPSRALAGVIAPPRRNPSSARRIWQYGNKIGFKFYSETTHSRFV
jgi:hypothetical protein